MIIDDDDDLIGQYCENCGEIMPCECDPDEPNQFDDMDAKPQPWD